MSTWLTESMASHGDRVAIFDGDGAYSYADMLGDARRWCDGLLRDIPPGAIVGFNGDYGRGAVSLLLALVMRRLMAVPLSRETAADHESLMELAEAEYSISGVDQSPVLHRRRHQATHALHATLRERGTPGPSSSRRDRPARPRAPSTTWTRA